MSLKCQVCYHIFNYDNILDILTTCKKINSFYGSQYIILTLIILIVYLNNTPQYCKTLWIPIVRKNWICVKVNVRA